MFESKWFKHGSFRFLRIPAIDVILNNQYLESESGQGKSW